MTHVSSCGLVSAGIVGFFWEGHLAGGLQLHGSLSLMERLNRIIHRLEKTWSSTPYWRVTVLLWGAAQTLTCAHVYVWQPTVFPLFHAGLVFTEWTQNNSKSLTLVELYTEYHAINCSFLFLKITRLFNTPVTMCETEISIVPLVSCRRCCSSSLPALPKHHRANRLIRQLIAVLVHWVFFFFFTSCKPLISLFILMALIWCSDPGERKMKSVFSPGG